jgi:hypothetical protein
MPQRPKMMPRALPGVLAVLVLIGALCVVAEDMPGEAAPVPPAVNPITVKDPLYPLEFRLPAPYWGYRDQQDLRQELSGRGGCANPAQSVPQNLLFVFGHEDAALYGRLELGPRSFLVRREDELEAYVDARAAVIQGQTGGTAQDVETEWSDEDGMLVHRLEFSAPLRTQGGCAPAPPPQADGERMHYLVLHYFVRPRDADALCFYMFLFGADSVFEELRPEVDSILDSVRYNGELAADFFDPQAPPEKGLSPEDADTGQKKSPLGGLMMPVLLVLAIWMMMRRRKPKAEEGAS